MSSQQRKQAIQTLLKRGQLKKLAVELNMSYSYLSQVFSPATAITFTSKLARRVEKALGLIDGQLDKDQQTVSFQKSPNGLLALVLRGRAATIQEQLIEQRVETSVAIKIGEICNHADLVIYNKDNSIFLVAEQSKDYDSTHKSEQLIMLMAITGARYGVAFAPDSGLSTDDDDLKYLTEHKRSVWYESKDGKIISTAVGPEGFYDYSGI